MKSISTDSRTRMRVLFGFLGASLLLVLFAVFFVDDPVARFVQTLSWSSATHMEGLGSPVLVVLSWMIVLAGAIQVADGFPLRRMMQILTIASFSLTWSVCVDEFVLKPLFGRKTPDSFLSSGIDAFRWFQGTPVTSFPSGHAVQIMSVGTVFLLAYPKYRAIWLSLMSVGLVALVLGNWHFVSDVIAGAAFGAIGGAATMTLWRRGEVAVA